MEITEKTTNSVPNHWLLTFSPSGQEVEKNKADIVKLSNDQNLGRVTFVEETASGRLSWEKRKISDVMEQANAGDKIIVSELSRLGRPKGPGKIKRDPFRQEIEALLANGSTQQFIAKRYHTTEANMHNWLRKNGISNPSDSG